MIIDGKEFFTAQPNRENFTHITAGSYEFDVPRQIFVNNPDGTRIDGRFNLDAQTGSCIEDSARIAPSVRIGARVIVEAHANIEENTTLTRNVWIGEGAHLSDRIVAHPDSVIEAGAFVQRKVSIGRLTRIGQRAVIGNRVELGESCIVGDDATIDPRLHLLRNTVVQAHSHLKNPELSQYRSTR